MVSEDGDRLIFELVDSTGKTAHIMIAREHAGTVAQLVTRAVEQSAKTRAQLGKSELHSIDPNTAPVVASFEVTWYPDKHRKLLTLKSSSPAFEFDFAIPTNIRDQASRPMHKAIAAELANDAMPASAANRTRPSA